VALATHAQLDPWGEYWLRDLVSAAQARMDEDFRRNRQLAMMVGNLFVSSPAKWEDFRGV
jgi:hypothetical protein